MASVGVNNSEDEMPNKHDVSKNTRSKTSVKNCVYNVVNTLMERKLAPLIIFSFKKKECETFATHLSKLNFNTGTNLNTDKLFCGYYVKTWCTINCTIK